MLAFHIVGRAVRYLDSGLLVQSPQALARANSFEGMYKSIKQRHCTETNSEVETVNIIMKAYMHKLLKPQLSNKLCSLK